MVVGILLGLMFFMWCAAIWASWSEEEHEAWTSGHMHPQWPKAA
jgi:hypothetical protein